MTLEDRYTRPLAGSAALVLIDVQRDFYADDAPMRLRVRGGDPGNGQVGESLPATWAADRACGPAYQPDGSNVDLVRRDR